MMKYPDDQKLVERILNRDEKALKAFYKSYAPRLETYIRIKISQLQDAEEVLQDTLLASLEAMRDYTGASSLYTYIYSIAHHKVVDYYRRKKLKQVVFSHLPQLENLISQLLSPEQKYDTKELKEKISRCFSALKPRHQEILKQKYIDGLTVREIALATNTTLKSVESVLFRARKLFIKLYPVV